MMGIDCFTTGVETISISNFGVGRVKLLAMGQGQEQVSVFLLWGIKII